MKGASVNNMKTLVKGLISIFKAQGIKCGLLLWLYGATWAGRQTFMLREISAIDRGRGNITLAELTRYTVGSSNHTCY